ncbi:hypothetical protein [Gottfriedia acidiceleris]|uniref:hypothetical protein n=1 Tax=Gottfriedia acidiceleris TaxID=371036 RepID=UPI003000CBDC
MDNDVLFLNYSFRDGEKPPDAISKFVQEMQSLGFQIQVFKQADGALRYVLQKND